MRLSLALLRKRPKLVEVEPNVPFKELLPLTLRDRVTGQSNKAGEKGCLHEMTILLTCLKENNFQNHLCEPQTAQFQKCFQTHVSTVRARKKMQQSGIPTPGATSLTHRQMTTYLRMYPHV